MAEIQKSLERTLFQGQYVFNYGGLVPNIFGAAPSPSPTPTPTQTPTQTTTPTITPTPSTTPTITPTPTTTPTTTPTITPTNTTTPTITPTKTLTPTPSSTPITFTTEYTAILTRASGLGYAAPSYSQQVLQNQLVVDLKAAGYWTKLGNMYIFKVDLTAGGSSAFTLINWITPANTISTLRFNTGGVVPPTHVSAGWRFTNENYIQLGSNSASVNNISTTTLNNSEGTYVAAFVANSSSGTNAMWSTNNNSWNTAKYNSTTAHNIFRGIGLTSAYDFTGIGFKAATIDGQTSADTTIIFTNDVAQTTKTKTAVDVGVGGGQMNLNFNGNDATSSFSWTSGFWFFGSGLSSGDMPGFQSIITNYMNA